MSTVRKSRLLGLRTLGVIAVTATLSAMSHPARASDEIVILSAEAMRSTFESVQPVFARAAKGLPVRFVYGTAMDVATRARADAAYDMVVLPPKPLADLEKDGLVRKGEDHPLGKVSLGIAVRSGAPRPDLTSVDALVAAIKATPSIGYADPASGATTGLYLTMMFKQIDLFDVVKSKSHLYPNGTSAMEALARGEIALAAGQISEATPVKGIDILGPLPPGVAFTTTYVASPAARSTHAEALAGIRAALTSDEIRTALRHNGFEPL